MVKITDIEILLDKKELEKIKDTSFFVTIRLLEEDTY